MFRYLGCLALIHQCSALRVAKENTDQLADRENQLDQLHTTTRRLARNVLAQLLEMDRQGVNVEEAVYGTGKSAGSYLLSWPAENKEQVITTVDAAMDFLWDVPDIAYILQREWGNIWHEAQVWPGSAATAHPLYSSQGEPAAIAKYFTDIGMCYVESLNTKFSSWLAGNSGTTGGAFDVRVAYNDVLYQMYICLSNELEGMFVECKENDTWITNTVIDDTDSNHNALRTMVAVRGDYITDDQYHCAEGYQVAMGAVGSLPWSSTR